MRKVLAGLLLGCVLLAGPAIGFGAEQQVIAAHELRKALEDNSAAAGEQYLGKTVQVQGIVLSTGMSKYMTPNVMLSDRADGEVQVICVLPRLDVGKLSDFTPGQSVVMSGRVHRAGERGVIMKDCQLVE